LRLGERSGRQVSTGSAKVVKGRLLIQLRDRDIRLDEGEFVVIP